MSMLDYRIQLLTAARAASPSVLPSVHQRVVVVGLTEFSSQSKELPMIGTNLPPLKRAAGSPTHR